MAEQHNHDVRFLMGNEAIGRGTSQAGLYRCRSISGHPLVRSPRIPCALEKELDHPIYLEWSINEKVAFEVAYGASLAGARSVAVMKMVGLNVASDPFMSRLTWGFEVGSLWSWPTIPAVISSQTEQDSRFFGWFAKVPVLDPGTPAEALEMTLRAFDLSEKYQVPVLLRPCLRVCHARQNVSLGSPHYLSTWDRSRRTGPDGRLYHVTD